MTRRNRLHVPGPARKNKEPIKCSATCIIKIIQKIKIFKKNKQLFIYYMYFPQNMTTCTHAAHTLLCITYSTT